MSQTEASLFKLQIMELLMLQEIDEVLTETSLEFVDNLRSGGLYL